MRLFGLEIKKAQPGAKGEDETWKSLKETVDKIFECTDADRKAMQSNLDFYNGKIWNVGELRKDDSRAVHNLVFSTIQSIAPTLTDNRPIWHVVSRYPVMQNLANSYDAASKYAWDKMEMSDVTHQVILDGMIQKVGLFFADYDYSAGEKGEVCIEPQDPKEFFIAPGYTDPWKAPFCGIRGRRPLSTFRRMFGKDSEILPDDEAELASMVNRKIGYGTAEDFELETYFATLYVVWMRGDVTENEIVTDVDPASNEGKPEKTVKEKSYPNGKFRYFTRSKDLGTRASEWKHGKPPWVPWYNYKKPHDFLGTSEVDNIKELVKEYNLQFQKVTGHTRKYADPNYELDTNKIQDVEMVKRTFHDGGNLYAVDKMNDKGDAISVVKTPQLLSDVYQILGLIPRMIEEDSGATDVSKGIVSKKQEQSASEIAILVESSYTRTRQRVRNLEWSLKRVLWMLISLMQQYYNEPRTYHVKKNDEIMTDQISNSPAFAQSMIASPEVVNKGQANEAMQAVGGQGEKLSPDESQQYDDYKEFIKIFGDQDPVYFPFDIGIETNSSLPLDKQSRANLAMQLFDKKAIDRKALLETIAFPKWEEVSQRMDQKEQDAAQATQGPPPGPQGLPGQVPLDIADQMQRIGQVGG
jgi:hypothetical protein